MTLQNNNNMQMTLQNNNNMQMTVQNNNNMQMTLWTIIIESFCLSKIWNLLISIISSVFLPRKA